MTLIIQLQQLWQRELHCSRELEPAPPPRTRVAWPTLVHAPPASACEQLVSSEVLSLP